MYRNYSDKSIVGAFSLVRFIPKNKAQDRYVNEKKNYDSLLSEHNKYNLTWSEASLLLSSLRM